MSVMRKQSQWAIPAAGLLMGALTIGLAGCGGGGDNAGSVVSLLNPIQVVAPVSVHASTPQNVNKGNGATVQSPISDGTLTGGVTQVTVNIPPGAIPADGTYAVEIIPTANGVLVRAKPALPVGAVTPVGEFAFGTVDQNGSIIVGNPITFTTSGTTITLNLTAAEVAAIQQALVNGNVLRVRIVNAAGNNYALTYQPNLTVSIAGNQIVITGVQAQGEYVVTLDTTASHPQGQVQ